MPWPVFKARSPASIALLAIGSAAELFTATIPILLFEGQLDAAWITYTISTYVRCAIWLVIALLLSPKRCWLRFIKLDILLVTGVGSCIAYIYLLDYSPGNQQWRTAAQVSYCVLIYIFIGYFRAMLKYYPWDRYSIYWYKVVRFYHCIFFTVNEILAHVKELNSEEESTLNDKIFAGLDLLFVTLTLHFLYDLFEFCFHKEHDVKHAAHHHSAHPQQDHELKQIS